MANKTSQKALGLVIFSLVFLNGCGARIVMDDPTVAIPTETASPTADLTPTSTLTATAVTPPNDQPTNPPPETSFSSVGFDFETDVRGWHTSEGEYKLAETSVTTTHFHTGAQSLQITTELFGDQSPEFAEKNYEKVYLGTEATGYFDSSVPEGVDRPGPYDLKGNRVSCFVYFPSGLVKSDNPPVHVRIFVKDVNFANQWGEEVDITDANAEQWIELALLVDNTEGADAQFDPTKVNALGVRFEVSNGSTLSSTGPVYIDSCAIEYP